MNLRTYLAFNGPICFATGSLASVTAATRDLFARDPGSQIIVFDAQSSEVSDFDYNQISEPYLEEVSEEVSEHLTNVSPGPGRPKLGVVAREVTLLPRHWDWLKAQPGGASVALRKLVEQAKRDNAGADQIREAQATSYKFMSAMAGGFVGFEEASRALFAANKVVFEALIATWPADICSHLRKLSAPIFSAEPAHHGI
jgi:uncharacterized protein